jgi:hypothetical protein
MSNSYQIQQQNCNFSSQNDITGTFRVPHAGRFWDQQAAIQRVGNINLYVYSLSAYTRKI